MLKGIPNIIPPELLKILAEMGHGDELTIGDANFPGHTYCDNVVRKDGHGAPEILDAILSLFPLDSFDDHPVTLMAVSPGDDTQPVIWDEYRKIVAKYDSNAADKIINIDRFDFYKKVAGRSTAVVMTGEKALYACIILKKGVL